MRWVVILAAICAALVAVQVLIWERRSGRRRPSTIGRVALAVLAIVLAGGAVYSAHLLGIFSIPLIVIAFGPVGLTVRWLILATRNSREAADAAWVASAPPLTRGQRWLRTISLPLFVIMVLVVGAVALVVGMLVGPH
jgi:hypothetical protein